jgi:hypothetical protein
MRPSNLRRPAAVLIVVAVALLATGAALSASRHRSPCHSAHSCPSDHHSYIWFDAAGQGWDCAKPGAAELTAADTQAIFYGGLRYQCHRAGGKSAPACGVERWAVKTLSDSAAPQVDLVPRPSTVSALHRLAAPPNLGARLPGAEMHAWRIHVRLLWSKLEDDSDIHLVVADVHTGQTMIVELVSPACAVGSPAVAQITAARAEFVRACGPASHSFNRLTGTATIDGVGFFDFLHNQRGVAPNGIELHPALRFAGSC